MASNAQILAVMEKFGLSRSIARDAIDLATDVACDEAKRKYGTPDLATGPYCPKCGQHVGFIVDGDKVTS